MVNGLSSAVSGVFGGSQNDTVKVMLDKAQQKGEDNTTLSYENIKKEAFQLINNAEKYNILPVDTSEITRQTVNETEKEAKQAFNDLNLDQNIDIFSTISLLI
jgi:hypothetical protein